MLQRAAAAIVASVNDGARLETSEFQPLKDALLAESPDAGDDAAKRCARLRGDLAAAVREALARHPNSSSSLIATASSSGQAPSTPRTGVEVRQNAWRAIDAEAFTVGRAPECDVQVSCDTTVSRLQFLVIALPSGSFLIVDAWSTTGTRVVKYLDDSTCTDFHASVPARRVAFALSPWRRIIIMVGNRTDVTLGTIRDSVATRMISEPPPANDSEGHSSNRTDIDSDSAQRVVPEESPSETSGRNEARGKAKAKAKGKAKGKGKAKAKAKGKAGKAEASREDDNSTARGGTGARGRPKAKTQPKPANEPASAPVATPSRAKSTDFWKGACVELHDLQAVADLNGRRGVVRRFLPAAERWEVEIEGVGVKRARAENMRLAQESQEF